MKGLGFEDVCFSKELQRLGILEGIQGIRKIMANRGNHRQGLGGKVDLINVIFDTQNPKLYFPPTPPQ